MTPGTERMVFLPVFGTKLAPISLIDEFGQFGEGCTGQGQVEATSIPQWYVCSSRHAVKAPSSMWKCHNGNPRVCCPVSNLRLSIHCWDSCFDKLCDGKNISKKRVFYCKF